MKAKIIAILSVIVLSMFVFVGCFGGSTSGSDSTSGSVSVSDSTTSESDSTKTSESTEPHVHNFVVEALTVKPTLTAKGKATLKCEECGKTEEEDVPALTDATVWTKDADVTIYPCLGGDDVYKSKRYGNVTVRIEPTAEHKNVESKKNEKPATCTEAGSYTKVMTCSVCNTVTSETEVSVPASGHKFTVEKTDAEGALKSAATCTKKAVYYKSCSVCGAVSDKDTDTFESGEPNGHTEVVDLAVAATCTVDGKTEGKHCSVCNEVLVAQQVVKAPGHTEVVDPAVAATCTKDGKTAGKHCSVCNAVIVAQTVVPALDHDYGEWTFVDATKHKRICSRDASHVEEGNHTAGDPVRENEVGTTCDAEGSYDEVVYCTVCGGEISRTHKTAASLGHNYGDWTPVDATNHERVCSRNPAHKETAAHNFGEFVGNKNGTHTKTCEDCGYKVTEDCKGGEATCTDKPTCEVCGDKYGDKDPDNHDIIHHDAKAPTCTVAGNEAYDTCSRCGYTTIKEIPAPGHTIVTDTEVIVKATCLTTGSHKEVKHCSKCDYKESENEVQDPKAQHNFVDHSCTVCHLADSYSGASVQFANGSVSAFGDSSVVGVVSFDGNGGATDTALHYSSSYKNATLTFTWVDYEKGIVCITAQGKKEVSSSGWGGYDDGGWSQEPEYTDYTEYLYGRFDKSTGVFVVSCDTAESHDKSKFGSRVFVFVPMTTVMDNTTVEASDNYNSVMKVGALTYTDANGAKHSLFITSKDVVFDVSFVDFNGAALSAKALTKSLVGSFIVKKGDETIAAYGKNADGAIVKLDEVYGTYNEKDGTGTLVLDGLGNATIGETVGAYVVSDGVVQVTVTAEDGKVTAYYEITLNGSVYTSVKPEVTVKFEVGEGHDAVPDKIVNKNTDVTLPVLENTTTELFKGWLLNGNSVGETYKFTANTTLTAHWMAKVVITVYDEVNGTETLYGGVGESLNEILKAHNTDHETREFLHYVFFDDEVEGNFVEDYTILESDVTIPVKAIYKNDYVVTVVLGNGLEDLPLHYAEGSNVYAKLPVYGDKVINGRVFKGWYRDAEKTVTLSKDYTITETDSITSVYADWTEVKYPFYGTINGFYYYSSGSGVNNPYKFGSAKTIIFDANGKTLDSSFSYSNPSVENYDENTGKFTLDSYKCIFDKDTGILIVGTDKIYVVGASDVCFAKDGSDALAAYTNNKDLKLMRLSYTVGDETKEVNILLYNGDLYTNILAYRKTADTEFVPFTKFTKLSGYGEPPFLRITDAEGNVIKDFKVKNGQYGEMVELDAYLGTYKFGEKDVTFDGLGNASYDGKTGTYELKDATAKSFDVYLADATEYYVVTLGDNGTCTVVKPEVTITFVTGEVHGAIEPMKYNINVVAALPVPSEEGYKFIGWFTDAGCTTPVAVDFKPTENITLYAKFESGIRVDVIFDSNDLADTYVVIASGDSVYEALESVKPTAAVGASKMLFDGWYLDAAFNTALTQDYTTSVAITVYAKWKAPHAMMGEYLYGANLDPNESGIVKEEDNLGDSYNFIVDENGNVTKWKTGVIIDFDPIKGTFAIDTGSKFYGGFNASVGVMYADFRSVQTMPYHDIGFAARKLDDGSIPIKTFNNAWDKGCTKLVRITYNNNGTETYKYVLIRNRIVEEVLAWSAVKSDDTAVTDFTKIYSDASVLTLTVGGGEYTFMKQDSNFVLRGEEYGDYTNTESNMHLDGFGNVTFGNETTGTYVFVSDNRYGVTLSDGTYFEVVIDGNAYVKEVPKVKITYNYNGHGEPENNAPVSVDKNSEYTLIADPVADGYKFRGWYKDAECKSKVESPFKPSADAVLYAKWDPAATVKFMDGTKVVRTVSTYVNDKLTEEDVAELETDATRRFVGWNTKDGTDGWGSKVSMSTTISEENVVYYAKFDKAIVITVVYGNGMETGTITGKYATDKVTIDLPEKRNDLTATGWYTDEALTTEWKSGSIVNDDLTVYCKWQTAHVMYGKYVGAEIYGTETFQNGKTLSIDVLGKGTGYKSGEITGYIEETGAFTYKCGTSLYSGSYDAVAKALAINYYTSGALSNDCYLFVLGTGSMTKNSAVVFDGKATRIVKVTVDNSTFYMVIKGDKLYAKVDVVGVDSTGAVVTDLSKAALITVKRGETQVLKFAVDKDGNTKDADGLDGTYTGYYGEVVVDGYGMITVGGSTVKYTIVNGRKITYVAANAQRVIELEEGTYAKVLDGYEGTYALPDGTTEELNGYGAATNGKTYVVSGGNIVLYSGNDSASYGIDVTNKKFLGKSIFAGHEFTGSFKYDDTDYDGMPIKTTVNYTIKFDNSSVISGHISTSNGLTVKFTGSFDNNTLTLTIPSENGVSWNATDYKSNSDLDGKVIVMVLDGNTLSVTSTSISWKPYSFKGGVATCEGFSL